MRTIQEPARVLSVREFDVVVAGGGTAGVPAAVAAARTGARTALVESKGYVGGIAVEGGTALHSLTGMGERMGSRIGPFGRREWRICWWQG